MVLHDHLSLNLPCYVSIDASRVSQTFWILNIKQPIMKVYLWTAKNDWQHQPSSTFHSLNQFFCFLDFSHSSRVFPLLLCFPTLYGKFTALPGYFESTVRLKRTQMDQPNYSVYFYLKESICSMSMELRRKFVIGGVINLPKTLFTRPEMTYKGFFFCSKMGNIQLQYINLVSWFLMALSCRLLIMSTC